MPKNVGITEGGSPKGLSGVRRLLIAEKSGLYSAWVPKDERPVKPIYIAENGTHLATDELMHGYTPVTVNVPGGMDGVDASGIVVPAPIGGIGCSVIGIDPSTGGIAQKTIDSHGLIRDLISSDSKEVPVKGDSEYVCKLRGLYPLTGYTPADPDFHGVPRQGVQSNMTVSYVMICQQKQAFTKSVIGSQLQGYLGKFNADNQDTGSGDIVQCNAYRFDGIYFPASHPAVYSSVTSFTARTSLKITIAPSYPRTCNPWYGAAYVIGDNRHITGLMTTEVNTRYLMDVVGTHYTDKIGYIKRKKNDDNCDLEWSCKYVNKTSRGYLIGVNLSLSGLYASGTCVREADGGTYDVETANCRGFSNLFLPPMEIEYCGRISEAPESAFILD